MKTTKRLLQGALSFTLLIATLSSCTEKVSEQKGTSASESVPNYPYTIEHPDNWEIGSTNNTMTALKGLKAWEEGKTDESASYFGDSVRVEFDGIDQKLSKDSLKVFFATGRSNFKTITNRMDDWESVISKDKTEEWVTLWYTQVWETKEGVKDSAALINNLKFKDGKIIRLSEYTRKFH